MRQIWILAVLLFFCGSIQAESTKKKLLVLIIASDNHPAFLELQKVWSAYMNLYPEAITAYFIKGDPLLEHDAELRGNTFYTKTVDNYKPGISKKTILTLKALESELDRYDYVLRTNLSSVYNFPKLLDFLKTLPKERCYAARPLMPSYEVPNEYSQIPFGWGAGFILSPDLAKLIVAEQEKLYMRVDDVPDDVLFGALLYEHKVPIIPIDCMAFVKREEWQAVKQTLPPNIFHFRAKSHYLTRKLDDPYEDELFIASDIAKTFYPNIELPGCYHSSYPLEIALSTVYAYHAAYPSSINQYMPYVKALAGECVTCCEQGDASLMWTWAIAEGLATGKKDGRKYVAVFSKMPRAEDLLLAKKLTHEHGIDFSLKHAIEPCDLLVTSQFPLEADTISKYIVISSESDLWQETKRFLLSHPDWRLNMRFEKFVILQRYP